MYTILFPNINPILFNIGALHVKWYGLAYVVGLLLALLLIKKINNLHKFKILNEGALDNLIFYGALGIIIGGRLGYVVFYTPEWIIHNPIQILKTWEGGMSFHGGVIGVLIATFLLCKRYASDFLATLDIIACVVPIGLFLGRVANFINAELYGKIATVPWAIIFPNTEGMPRHPSQLYEALGEGLLLFFIMNFLYNIFIRKNIIQKYKGILSGLFLINYGLIRIVIEEFRESDYTLSITLFDHILTSGQTLSLFMILFGFIMIISICVNVKKKQ